VINQSSNQSILTTQLLKNEMAPTESTLVEHYSSSMTNYSTHNSHVYTTPHPSYVKPDTPNLTISASFVPKKSVSAFIFIHANTSQTDMNSHSLESKQQITKTHETVEMTSTSSSETRKLPKPSFMSSSPIIGPIESWDSDEDDAWIEVRSKINNDKSTIGRCLEISIQGVILLFLIFYGFSQHSGIT